MLIRLVGHHPKNPQHIDKLIAIKGLPEKWLFRDTKHGRELAPPWQADADQNIPIAIRHLCEPMEIAVYFPPIERGREPVIDTRKILGLKLDYMNGPGREMWEQIERYIDQTWPRTEKLPEPVKVAPDQKSPFSLEPSQIPVVDLNEVYERPVLKKPEPELPKTVVAETLTPPPTSFSCPDCGGAFAKQQGLRMHRMKRHQEKVGA